MTRPEERNPNSTLRLVVRVSSASGRAMLDGEDGSRSDEVRRAALARVGGCLSYLSQLFGELTAGEQRRATSALHDAFAWGLLAFVHDRAERPEPRSHEADLINDALEEIKDQLLRHGVKLVKEALFRRAETHHPRHTDAELRRTFELAVRRVVERVLVDARTTTARRRMSVDIAGRAGKELRLILAAFGNDKAFQTQPSIAILDRDLDEAVGELVRAGAAEGTPMSHEWASLFQAENRLRQVALLPPRNRQLALGATTGELLQLVQTGEPPIEPTNTDEAIGRIGIALANIGRARLRAVRNIERKLKEPAEPADESVVLSILSLALSMAVAGVGGYIASVAVRGLRTAAILRSARFDGIAPQLRPAILALEPLGVFGTPPPEVGSDLDAGLSEAIQSLVGGVVPSNEILRWIAPRDRKVTTPVGVSELTAKILRDPRNLFAAGLERGLEDADAKAQLRLLALRSAFQTVPIEQLHEVERRLSAVADKAEDAQLYVAMLEWMNFLARWQLGAIDATERGAKLTDSQWHTAPGCVTVDCLVDRERPATTPVTLHDARAGVDAMMWKAVQYVAQDLPIGRLPVNHIYRFYLGTPAPGTSSIVVRVQAPVGASEQMNDYDGVARRALAAITLNLAFGLELDLAIRHGRSSREGARLADKLEKVDFRALFKTRKHLVEEAQKVSTAKVRADG